MGKKKKTTTKPATKTQSGRAVAPAKHHVFPFPGAAWEVDIGLVKALGELETSLGMPLWLLVQNGEDEDWNTISPTVKQVLFAARSMGKVSLKRGQKVALLIDSFGGSARSAFEIATLLRKHCGGFTALVPRRAKSAATLISLGADEIILGEYGELGPLDVQVPDPEHEEIRSGLDEVQALERLHAFVMAAFDRMMPMFLRRTGMKQATLMPHISRLITDMTKPMFANVDVVRYTQMSRLLKVGEEYARRLLAHRFSSNDANDIARKLVEKYPEHGFIIDRKEADEIGLKTTLATDEQRDIMHEIAELLSGVTAIGRIASVLGSQP